MKKSNTTALLLASLAVSSLSNGQMIEIRHKLKGIDTDAEYELIKAKKSKLSANLRKLIVLEKES